LTVKCDLSYVYMDQKRHMVNTFNPSIMGDIQ